MNSISPQDFIEGQVLLFDKPLEWSSFDVVKKIRNQLRRKIKKKKIKVGHAGTLDPLATGLIILCTGRKTKTINEIQQLSKEYIADIHLGATTPSFDLETEIDQQFDFKHITKAQVIETLQNFKGKQQQVPPVFSAKRINGTRAYTHAREGKKIEMKPADIKIYGIELLNFELPEIKIKIHCSKGTYIRSLARDLGRALNSGAYLSGLRRTKIGDFCVEDAMLIPDFKKILDNWD